METVNGIKRIVGEQAFKSLRFYGYKFLHSIHKPFTLQQFQDYLSQELGIKKGDTVFIHSSVEKLNIVFHPHQVIDILQEITGPSGNLIFPCWHFNYRAEEYLENTQNVFNVKRSATVMGLLPEIARRVKGAQRSLHPTNSVVAIGPNAYDLVKDHHLSEYPCDSNSPFYKIMDFNGKILGLGEKPETSLSFVHCVEDEMKDRFPVITRTEKVFNAKVIDHSGNTIIVNTLAAHKNIGNRDIKGFFNKFINDAECKVLKRKGSWFYISDAQNLFEKLWSLADQGKTIYKY
jgi:aminoglycoside 3-N-acetyltransferase